MTGQHLQKSNQLKKQIKEIEDFLFYAERTFTGKIIKKVDYYIFKTTGDGVFDKELNLNAELKERMLEMTRGYLQELKKELEKL